jgi:O-antigen ligase
MREHVEDRLERIGYQLGQAGALGMMVSMPISRAAFNGCVLALIIGWVLSGAYRNLLTDLRAHPALLMCVAFFGLVLLSTSYSVAPFADRWSQVSAYSKLLYIPVMVGVMKDPAWIRRAWTGLWLGLSLVMLVFLVDIWIDIPGTKGSASGTPGVFNNTIVQGLNFAVLSILSTYLWAKIPDKKNVSAWRWMALALISAAATLWGNPSRGAQLALLAGLIVSAFFYAPRRLRWWVAVATTLALVTMAISSQRLTARFEKAAHEAHTAAVQKDTSVGMRLNAWQAGLSVWRTSPWLGQGAGAYRYLMHTEYSEQLGGCPSPICEQPHNQFILTLSEQGVLGLLALLALLLLCARSSRSEDDRLLTFSRAFVLLFAVHSCFDSGLQMNTQVFVFIVVTGLLISSAKGGHHEQTDRSCK